MERIEDNPLSTIIKDGGFTAIFRTIACIGDSLSSGEHESLDENGVRGYHDYYEYSWGQYIARKCGVNVTNYSVGGLTAKEFHALADHTKCFTPENACKLRGENKRRVEENQAPRFRYKEDKDKRIKGETEEDRKRGG